MEGVGGRVKDHSRGRLCYLKKKVEGIGREVAQPPPAVWLEQYNYEIRIFPGLHRSGAQSEL